MIYSEYIKIYTKRIYLAFLRKKGGRAKGKLIDPWSNLIFKQKHNDLLQQASKIEIFISNC